jgi:hypothetical protein
MTAHRTEAYNTQSLWTCFFMGLQPIQNWDDFYLWDRFLMDRPEIRSVIEIGTGGGGASLFLLMQSIARGFTFDTFDQFAAPAWILSPLAKRLELEKHFHVGDVWIAQKAEIHRLIGDPANHPMVLFCDGGDKPREFKEFGGLLHAGDYIVVHDWMNEFGPVDMKAVAVTELLIAECDGLRSMTRFMVKQ